ncbi:MAG: hypothetical protein CM15mP49_30750 [Actinomycetota bacterium]|nr:MAG: hypothetical protein CM15mP49_30750 [Actinomycetota bacterium]
MPEAQEGGSIALVHDGDVITIDDESHEITLKVSDEELAVEPNSGWHRRSKLHQEPCGNTFAS